MHGLEMSVLSDSAAVRLKHLYEIWKWMGKVLYQEILDTGHWKSALSNFTMSQNDTVYALLLDVNPLPSPENIQHYFTLDWFETYLPLSAVPGVFETSSISFVTQ